MLKKTSFCLLFFALMYLGGFAQLADKQAGTETQKLYKNLYHIYGKRILLGHQDDLAYGVGWKYQEGRSDIKELTGQYPAVMGWDVAGLEKDRPVNIDGVPFKTIEKFIKRTYQNGGINTLSWHMNNPLNDATAWDKTEGSVKSALPGQAKHALFKTWLDKFAVFVQALRGENGEAIPILFRPFHEHSGDWFWWGAKGGSADEYKALWRFTVTYLNQEKKLHNLIFVYNTSDFKTAEEYLRRYPGDDCVDILSFDTYQYGKVENGTAFKTKLIQGLDIQSQIAKAKSKIAALGETGYVEVPDPEWWTNVLWKGIEKAKPIYVLLWRNAGYRPKENDQHYYAPYKGHASAADFLKTLGDKGFMLQNDLKKYNPYK